MNKCLNEYKFRPNPIADYGIVCPCASENSKYEVVATLAPSFLLDLLHSRR